MSAPGASAPTVQTGPGGEDRTGAGRGPRLARRARRLWPVGLTVAAIAVGLLARPGPGLDRQLEQAQADARAGRYERAAATLDRMARGRTPTPVERLLRGQVAAARDQTDAALAELAAIPDAHPLAPLARLSAGQLEARRGRLRAAEAAFRATLELTPGSVPARREMVYILSIQRRLPELDEQLTALARLGALDLTHLIHWGMIRHAEWAAATDLAPLRRYVAADPSDRASRLALAEALRRTGRASEAVEVLATLPESDPDARAERAEAALAGGDADAAEALVADGPAGHPALDRLRGRLALARGDAPLAARMLRAALDADPADHATRHALALALAASGEAEEAARLRATLRREDELGQLLLQARRDGLRDPSLASRIGRACADVGRPEEARAWLRLAIGRDPLDEAAQAALHRLGPQQ